MSETKSNRDVAANITIAWIKAKSENTVAGTGGDSDRGIPNDAEISQFFKTIYQAVNTPNS